MFRTIISFCKNLGKTYIDVYEWQSVVVTTRRLQKAPQFAHLTTRRPSLKFDGWRLAHAVVKTDFLDSRDLRLPGIAFLLQAVGLIDMVKPPFTLKQGTSTALNDVSATSLTARVGQGLTYLYALELKFQFVAHLNSYVKQNYPKLKHLAMADFIFTNWTGHTALFESKATFSQATNDPKHIKGVLKKALLEQVNPWLTGRISPSPSKGYVVYSRIHESDSAISFVDPIGLDDEPADLPMSQEQVIRCNYAGWLRAMGLRDAAAILERPIHDAITLSGVKPAVEMRFDIYEHAGRKYAVHTMPAEPLTYPLVGLDLSVLQAIAATLQNPHLLLSEKVASLPKQAITSPETFSIFPDGSVFGLLGEPVEQISLAL